ncbi:MAG: hypothetical protein ACRD36_02595, partial [Candidatus Acidiferrum sp.]
LKGAETVARELIRSAVGRVFSKHFTEVNFQPVIQWFELGGELKFADQATARDRFQQLSKIQGLLEHVNRLGVTSQKESRSAGDSASSSATAGSSTAPFGSASSGPSAAAAAAEMILEGLWAHRRIGRSEEKGYYAEKQRQPDQRERETPGRPPRRQFN